jgi:hypothetical protein
MPHEWITDRLPTEADADGEGDVKVPDAFGGGKRWQHYSLVDLGQPWRSALAWVAPTHPFAIGQRWQRRDGKIVTVTTVDADGNFPVIADAICYRIDGTTPTYNEGRRLVRLVSSLKPAPAPTRKVVQIAVGVELLALCDDGTMWAISESGGPWTQLRASPQPEA